ncbi:MAG: transposase [Rhodospirillaceae bacterium]
MTAAAKARPGKRIRLFFQDEARVGQKGRTCHRWWVKGQRPPGLCDQRFDWTYIFATVEPATGAEFALVLPTVPTVTMNLFLAEFAKTLNPDDHVVMVLDGAGWHASAALAIPDNVTLVPLPPYSPQCNPGAGSGHKPSSICHSARACRARGSRPAAHRASH